ncbi:MAG: thioredoxin family protein [Acidimicrobiia bacterium]|jgi:small redox-active disulfide protein 2
MNIKVLGSGCPNCQTLEKRTVEAAGQLGIEAAVEKVTDYGDIASYGVMSTPALVIDEQVVMSGRVPTVPELVTMLATAS